MHSIIQDPVYNAQGGSTVCTTVLYHSGMIELMKQYLSMPIEYMEVPTHEPTGH